MDWTGAGVSKYLPPWLEGTAADRYARERRLDPYATSMRDFDDVTPNLQAIRDGRALKLTDPTQRVADLRAAGLCVDSATLTPFGAAVLRLWEELGVANEDIGDEFGRLLIYVYQGRAVEEPGVVQFLDYWSDLRACFDPIELIDNWDALYAINYLDFPRSKFSPGEALRESRISAPDIEFDLLDFARDNKLSEAAVTGAARIVEAIGNKVPRGRHRASFCMALETVLSEGRAVDVLLERFGVPKKPRTWTSFTDVQKAKIAEIASEFDVPVAKSSGGASIFVEPVSSAKDAEVEQSAELKLPANIDFSKVVVDRPKPKSISAERAETERRGGSKKIDYQKRSRANDAVGRLGEVFAVAYERWRLRKQPELAAQVRHVALEDDGLGYDIASFEIDGTPRYVEVKGTLASIETRFFITANEFECAKRLAKQYVLLRVADLCEDPKCHEIRFPFDETLVLETDVYVVRFK